MPIPDFQSIMLPLMRLCADGKEHAISETTETLANQFKLTEDERKGGRGLGGTGSALE